ncbi:MAG: Lrp/AsnC family transcriptional regulator [Pseudomonadota bacterium]
MTQKLHPDDRQILHHLQQNARVGVDALAAETGVSVSSVQRRIKSLKTRGIITSEVAVVSAEKVGQSMGFVVMVELERERLDQIDAFARRCQADPQVQQCYYITGDADFCLICTAADMAEFEDLTKRLFFQDSNVRRFRSSVMMSKRKVGLTVRV